MARAMLRQAGASLHQPGPAAHQRWPPALANARMAGGMELA
jgi:hypothetical protein